MGSGYSRSPFDSLALQQKAFAVHVNDTFSQEAELKLYVLHLYREKKEMTFMENVKEI